MKCEGLSDEYYLSGDAADKVSFKSYQMATTCLKALLESDAELSAKMTDEVILEDGRILVVSVAAYANEAVKG